MREKQIRPLCHDDATVTTPQSEEAISIVATLDNLARLVDCSLMDTVNCVPDAKASGVGHAPVLAIFSGFRVCCNYGQTPAHRLSDASEIH